MRADHRILDADRHVMEPMELWREYLPADLRARAPYLAEPEVKGTLEDRVRLYGAKGLFPLSPVLMLDGQPAWNKISPHAHVEMSWSARERHAQLTASTEPVGQLRSMDSTGVDVAFLFPTLATYLVGIDTLDAPMAGAFARAYNDWLRGYCQEDPARLQGVGLMSAHDPVTMVEELERVAGFGWKAVVVRPNPVKGRLLSHPDHEPFWAACERLSIAVAIHEGTHTRLPSTGADRFDTRFALHACSHPMEQMMALLALIEGGVLERHPRLRVAFLEAGCGWLPYWLHRLDALEYAHFPEEVAANVKRKPSEYFKRQCFVAIEPDEPCLPALVAHLGADNLLFGTDFPHLDHDDDIVDKALGLTRSLPDDVVRKILWDNPARFYGVGDDAAKGA